MNRYRLTPALAFSLILALGLGARMLIGKVYSATSAQLLLDTLSDSALYIGSACLGGSATILALLLTLAGLVRRDEADFNHNVYEDVIKIGRSAMTTLLSSIALLLLLTGPTGELKELPTQWYPTFYNIMFGMVAVTLAILAATITRIYLTLTCIVNEWRD